ncbi:hypothetical protein [Shimwellia blattae]|uniref:Metal-dependent hydrolase n=1 Tax=Shimwellia blattae (strain ATCC 29907 / DSM 4481 / JCM 1650 / NBRC 105725 / CDC 9005-74) TaxID=630626 RepID=I2B5N5_SHIBC|nr:hypothetical protein [Shimwellia blattae]AFJ45839.1 hypothetical protein EBL_c07160 [Shimwellia blattae DSM 4481 = NBRC 105725]GAB81601.1 hypothetical protein EB105725_15_00010 [Shimwellia blattae DSM 4481 = NBRC 105725]VDY63317.1 alanyl-tRNA synthetase [Shimwellia blattae]VEC21093.1 alanyl-tRNA synthetase [Shimwellia blattae]
MQQNQCYLEDTYRFNTVSSVIATGVDGGGQWIALQDNIFHPQGGGQPADTGWVNKIPVVVKKHPSGLVVLYPQSSFSPPVGTNVASAVSADTRVYHAALHTAGHLLNREMRQFGWIAVRGHHFPGESRVEFSAVESSAIPAERLDATDIESIICQCIQQGAAIRCWFEGATRLCQIDQSEPVPCAGTHTDDLARINAFSLKGIKFKKGTLRISYDAGHAPLGEYYV